MTDAPAPTAAPAATRGEATPPIDVPPIDLPATVIALPPTPIERPSTEVAIPPTTNAQLSSSVDAPRAAKNDPPTLPPQALAGPVGSRGTAWGAALARAPIPEVAPVVRPAPISEPAPRTPQPPASVRVDATFDTLILTVTPARPAAPVEPVAAPLPVTPAVPETPSEVAAAPADPSQAPTLILDRSILNGPPPALQREAPAEGDAMAAEAALADTKTFELESARVPATGAVPVADLASVSGTASVADLALGAGTTPVGDLAPVADTAPGGDRAPLVDAVSVNGVVPFAEAASVSGAVSIVDAASVGGAFPTVDGVPTAVAVPAVAAVAGSRGMTKAAVAVPGGMTAGMARPTTVARTVFALLAVVTAGLVAFGITTWLMPRQGSALDAMQQASQQKGARDARRPATRADGSAASGAAASGGGTNGGGNGGGSAEAGVVAAGAAGAAGIAPGATALEIRSNPSGARIVVGGRERGVTPVTVTDLPPGRHEVLIFGPFTPNMRHVDLVSGVRAVLNISATEDAASATARDGAQPSNTPAAGAGAAAAAGAPGAARPGQPNAAGTSTSTATRATPGSSAADAPTMSANTTPGREGSAPAGSATPTTPAQPTSATTAPGSPASSGSGTSGSSAPLSPSASTSPATSTGNSRGGTSLVVESPLALDIVANGRRVGNSGNGSVALPPGSYELELLNDSVDYREVTTVHLSAGQRLVLPIEVPQSTLTVEAAPGTHVWVDGRDVGETPLAQLALPIGPHEVLFRHPQFGERKVTALVKVGLTARIAVDFKASQP